MIDLQETAINILQPVLEMSVVLAADYADACGRDVVLAEDFEYAIKYCAMHTVGERLGSILPIRPPRESEADVSDDEDEDEDEEDGVDLEFVEEGDEPDFTRYEGDDEFFNKVNEAKDTWDAWEPTNPAESMLKKAIDSYNGGF